LGLKQKAKTKGLD